MRTLLGFAVILALTCSATAAQNKIDGAKLVGKWEPVTPKKGEVMVMEFTKDGKITITGEKDLKIEGTYKLDGDKLALNVKFMDVEIKEVVTLTKLTDTEMEGKDKEGKAESFKKVKSEPKKEK